MKVYRSINLYSRQVFISLCLAYDLVEYCFTFTLYAIYTFLYTLKS